MSKLFASSKHENYITAIEKVSGALINHPTFEGFPDEVYSEGYYKESLTEYKRQLLDEETELTYIDWIEETFINQVLYGDGEF